MNEGVPDKPLKEIEEIAHNIISSLDQNMSATVEERVVMPFAGDEYDDAVLHFEHPSDPDMEWTMDVNRAPEYVEGKLSDVIKNVYEEKDEKRRIPEISDEEFQKFFQNGGGSVTPPNENVVAEKEADLLTETRADIDAMFSQTSGETPATDASPAVE